MTKITIKFPDGKKKTIAKPSSLVIRANLPLLAITASKALVQDRFISMDMLCEDVADILKNDFGCAILKETDVTKMLPDGTHPITEGHPSINRTSLSLYYVVRYDMAKTDQYIGYYEDNFELSKISVTIETDMCLRITDHKFESYDFGDTRDYINKELKQLNEQEESAPVYRRHDQLEIPISPKVRSEYLNGLQEIKEAIRTEFINLRQEVYLYLSRRR